jgi:hypothetical protein
MSGADRLDIPAIDIGRGVSLLEYKLTTGATHAMQTPSPIRNREQEERENWSSEPEIQESG